jgi:hypothetical protein
MNARFALAAIMITAFVASQASATVLSASGQAVGTKASKADYLRVTHVQAELNTTMKDINDAAVASSPLSAPAPSTGQSGFLLQEREGEGGKNYGDPTPPGIPHDDGLDDGRLMVPGSIRGGQDPGTYSDNRRSMGNRRGGGGGGNKHGGGAHAAPEPSTWMLLGVGLALFGGYATMRRRMALEN